MPHPWEMPYYPKKMASNNMKQMLLFDDEEKEKPINVATIPMRSPFRYAGGKTWFVPYIRKWLSI